MSWKKRTPHKPREGLSRQPPTIAGPRLPDHVRRPLTVALLLGLLLSGFTPGALGTHLPPSPPTNLNPGDLTTGVSVNPRLTWSPVGGPHGGANVQYWVYYEHSPDQNRAPPNLIGCSETPDNWCDLPTLNYAFIYKWQVRAYYKTWNGDGWTIGPSSYSPVLLFSTENDPLAAPNTPVAMSPADGTINHPTSLRLSWVGSGPAGTQNLHFQVFLEQTWDGSRTSPWGVACMQTQNMYCDVSGLQPYAMYKWQVRAYYIVGGNVGDSAYTSVFLFSTVGHYKVELKAWVPQWRLVDPDLWNDGDGWQNYPAPFDFSPPCYRSHSEAPKQVRGWFIGDNHDAFGDPYRGRAYVEFDVEGTRIKNLALQSDARISEKWRQYKWQDGSTETCLYEAAPGLMDSSGTGQTGTSSFQVKFATWTPLVHSTAGIIPKAEARLSGEMLSTGDMRIRYVEDNFPSYGLIVVRNGVTQLTQTSSVSCYRDDQVMGSSGYYKTGYGLSTEQPERTEFVRPSDVGRMNVFASDMTTFWATAC